jgi:hypothetical protein
LGTLDLALAPDEGRGVPVVDFGEVADCLDQLRDAGKAGSGQGLSAEDAEPDFHLVEPACRGWGEVESNVRVCRQPVVVLFVGGEVVEDDMDFPIGRLLSDQVGQQAAPGTGLWSSHQKASIRGGCRARGPRYAWLFSATPKIVRASIAPRASELPMAM